MEKGLLIFFTGMLLWSVQTQAQEVSLIPTGIYQYVDAQEIKSFIKIQQENRAIIFSYSEGDMEAFEAVDIDLKNDSTFLCRPHGGLYFYREKEKCLILPLIDIRGNDIDKKYCLYQELEGD